MIDGNDYVVEDTITVDFMAEAAINPNLNGWGGEPDEEALREANDAYQIAEFLDNNPQVQAVIWTQARYGIDFAIVRGPMTTSEKEALR